MTIAVLLDDTSFCFQFTITIAIEAVVVTEIKKDLPTTDEKVRRSEEGGGRRMALVSYYLPLCSPARSAISDADGRGNTEGVTNFVNLISAVAVALDNNLKLAAAAAMRRLRRFK